MGCWGTGVTQSDEYCDVYESFMEEYDKGTEVPRITEKILDGFREEFDEDDVAEVYAVYNTKHDGLLTFDEFIAYVKDVENGDETLLLQHRFNAIDKDGNGYLDIDEVIEFQKLCGNYLTREEAELIFKEMDDNGDGRISLEEFLAYSAQ